jgi:carboxypeptidase C (cathepsin A)
MRRIVAALCIFAFGALTPVACAQEGAGPPAPRRFKIARSGAFGGVRIAYDTIVAETFLADAAGKRAASVVSISYIRTDAPQGSVRPVVFAFNGGPGSASVWLHMGLLGPRRIAFGDDVKPETVPPFRLADNADSPLDVADIVLFDPPGTGFSRVLPDAKPEQFYGTEADAKATCDFIMSWVREHRRWNSPKYLMGESYGSIRAAVVAKRLAGGPTGSGSMDGITLNGVILLGQAMDIHSGGQAGDDRRFLTSLPSLAATAWYHGKVSRSGRTLETQVADARAFAAGDYLRALYAGAALPEQERRQIARRLAALTGLSERFVLANDLRISNADFSRELLAEEAKQVGMYDSRFTLPLQASGGDPVADDPAMGQYVPGFIAAFEEYLRGELGVAIDEPYRAIEFRTVNSRWDYGFGPGVPASRNYATDLAAAMRRNPQMRLFVGSGWYDFVTPAGHADYLIAHSGIPLAATRFHYYASGHMPYLGPESRRQLAEDLRAFLREKTR